MILARDFDFLPVTAAVFGRKSKPRSHHFYITGLHETDTEAGIAFAEKDGAMLVELRTGGAGKGSCSMVPPSMHTKSGERVTWDSEGEPSPEPGEELKRRVALLAAAALLVRHYPVEGKRHAAALVLGGVLARAHWKPEDIAWFVGAVATVAGDREEVDDRKQSAADAVPLLADGEECPGLPRMREEWGEGIANQFAEWINYDAVNGNGSDANDDGDGDDEELGPSEAHPTRPTR